MTSFLDYSKGYEVKENQSAATFLAALLKQKKAFETGELNRRSWVKIVGDAHHVKLGKLEKTYRLAGKADVSDFLHRAAVAAQSEPEFQALIEAAYGQPGEEPPTRRGRKPKSAAATVDTDVSRIPLRPRT